MSHDRIHKANTAKSLRTARVSFTVIVVQIGDNMTPDTDEIHRMRAFNTSKLLRKVLQQSRMMMMAVVMMMTEEYLNYSFKICVLSLVRWQEAVCRTMAATLKSPIWTSIEVCMSRKTATSHTSQTQQSDCFVAFLLTLVAASQRAGAAHSAARGKGIGACGSQRPLQ